MGMLVLYMSAESIRITAILLQPFMPEKMKAALDMMNVDESKRSFDHATIGADLSYGREEADLPEDWKKTHEFLFPMLLSSH